MRISVVPFTADFVPAVSAFNERMRRSAVAVDFLLPSQPNASVAGRTLTHTQLLAVDETGSVRGGLLRVEHEAIGGGRPLRVSNYQALLSEGIADSRFSMVALSLVKYMQRTSPEAFIVGMGHPDRPLPRLLAAAGWTITPIPFLFRPVNAKRMLMRLPLFQNNSRLRRISSALAHTGMATVGAKAWSLRSVPTAFLSRGYAAERITRWDSWADRLWLETRALYSFAVQRDGAGLDVLYPLHDDRYIAVAVRRRRDIVGWAVGVRTAMQRHPHFGDLTVATMLDAVALPDCVPAVAHLASTIIARDADLVVSNQSHRLWRAGLSACGFLPGPSNYLLATSQPLSGAIADKGWPNVHVVRGDGDGRIHL